MTSCHPPYFLHLSYKLLGGLDKNPGITAWHHPACTLGSNCSCNSCRVAINSRGMLVAGWKMRLPPLPPRKLAWNPQQLVVCRCFSFSKGGIFRFHVGFQWFSGVYHQSFIPTLTPHMSFGTCVYIEPLKIPQALFFVEV